MRNYGICFYAYTPLAGGVLTGKHKNFAQIPGSGRFSFNNQYTERYWKSAYFDVLDSMTTACAKYDLMPTNAALCWLIHHSQLSAKDGDGIILGASKFSHLHENLIHVGGGKLPAEIVEILDHGWQQVKPHCFRYFRH